MTLQILQIIFAVLLIIAILMQQKRYNDAIAHYRAALQVNPSYAAAKKNLKIALALAKQAAPPPD